MKLNPSKCVFGVTTGKFLGFMVSQRGIEVNPEKVWAIIELEPPKTEGSAELERKSCGPKQIRLQSDR